VNAPQPVMKSNRRSTLLATTGLGLVVLAVLVPLFFKFHVVVNSHGAQAHMAFLEAQELAEAGKREEALRAYASAIAQFHEHVNLPKETEAFLRLHAVPTRRCTPAAHDEAMQLLSAFDRLPDSLRTEPLADIVVDRVEACAHEVGSATPAEAFVSLSLVEQALEIGLSASSRERVNLHAHALRRDLVRALEQDRPRAALPLLVALPEREAHAKVLRILQLLGPSTSVWTEPTVKSWIETAEVHGVASEAERFGATVREVEARADRTRQVGTNEQELRAIAGEEAALVLAEQLRSRGLHDEALGALRAIGPTGHLSAPSRFLFARCLQDAGRLQEADVLLTALLEEQVPSFLGRVRRGNAGRMDVGEVLADKTPTEASLLLGAVRIQRAASSTGEAQRSHLRGAVDALLPVADVARNLPVYHQLTSVAYFRLGEVDKGHAHVDAMLRRKDPATDMQAYEILRELGFAERAAEVLEALYARGDETWRYRAAWERSVMARTHEEKGHWLERCDPTQEPVQRARMENRAHLAADEGRCDEADATFAIVARAHETDPGAGKNNAALTYAARFGCTGDAAHLRKALELFEASLRENPLSTTVAENCARTAEHLGLVRVLDRWANTKLLRPSGEEARALVDSLLRSKLAPQVREALAGEPHLKRSLELTKRQQELAPNRRAHDRHLRWYSWMQDDASLRALMVRVEALGAASETTLPVLEQDRAAELAALNGRVHITQQRVARTKGANGPTRSLALLMHKDSLAGRASITVAEADLTAVLDVTKEAVRAWPQAGLDDETVDALVWVGMKKGAATCPALAEAIKEKERTHSTTTLLVNALRGAAGAESAACLRASSEWLEAAEILRGRPPTLHAHVLGVALGDEALTRRGAGQVSSEETLLHAKLALWIRGGPNEKAWFEEVKAGAIR
jgi:tetratricopeptide (TPR) repeat protein